ncbi:MULTISPECIES: uroporphyrinogen-III C-methyltransferase [Caldilinea]|jgi:uroporphyrin-III C-methyltransferase|uniref:uroporphyrinogen-III C-methyltransferase n=2 Tax=Caldilinea TaxID=233191 RepID=I0I3S9_CALAS|nr:MULTISPECIES: uroporphyrinogen-III C-methyltransferase [Caldilinea]BAL99916.1 putative uroporphyrinogen-III C-methyltransferase [Caldilinea aerophila DSM 14535 = NBRC 104270]GIV73413.1 MAG: uroporphyrin-III C-methyltransferase [Caldilinea sp.]
MNNQNKCPNGIIGAVYLVGAGPGAPDLITLRGAELLRRAGAVLYDALANNALLGLTRDDAELIYVGKRAGAHALSQQEINHLLLEKACQHLVVVRLKGGDPFVFGRGGEEMEFLHRHGVPVEVVPGVSSAIAGPAAAGIPVTHRSVSRSFAVVTGHTVDGLDAPNWQALAQIDTLVVLMGVATAGEIARRLIAAGRSPETPAAVVQSATLPDQRQVIATLATLVQAMRDAKIGTPAVLVIGEVVRLAQVVPTPLTWPAPMLRKELTPAPS